MAKTRKLTKREMDEINDLIRPGFGPKLQIHSGSYEEKDDGTPRYNLGIGDPVVYVSAENKKRIAMMLKEKFRDAEYFSGGSRIA